MAVAKSKKSKMSQWVAEALAHAEMSQSEMARQLDGRFRGGYDRSVVNKMVMDKRRVEADEMLAIGEITKFPIPDALRRSFDLRSEDIAATSLNGDRKKGVKLKGYVGAGSETHFYKYADEDFDTVDPPAGASDQTIAVQIKGKSWGPRMDGWLVFYDDVRSPITEDMYNQPCVVGLADDRILLKTIKRERDGSFTLQSNSDEADIKNAVIEWAAKVIGMRPR